MHRKSRVIALFMIALAGCTGPEHFGEELSPWSGEITQAQCESDLSVPFVDEHGQPCNLPADAETCAGIDWDKDDLPDKDHACFGFSEDLDECENCNRLDLPSSGPTQWSQCRNQQYMDCLMNGHISDYGGLCFVTKPDDISHDAGSQPRVTTREVCYYYQKTGSWPPPCPESACNPVDAGTPDAKPADAGEADTGVADTGVADTGVPDTGVPDTSVPDTGVPDAGVPDAGVRDASPVAPL